MTSYKHPDHDITVDVVDDRAFIFGNDLPVEGEVIRADGRLWKIGIMDSSDPPLLHPCDSVPDVGLWWDADEE